MSLPHNHTGALLCMRGDTATGFKIGTLYAAQDGRIRNDRGAQYSIGTTGNATFQPFRGTHSRWTPPPPRDETRVPRPLDEWHEDRGDVLWWCWDGNDWLGEAPYVGTPLDLGQTVECHAHRETGEKPAARFDVGGWPGYHTHWTPLPSKPHAPNQST